MKISLVKITSIVFILVLGHQSFPQILEKESTFPLTIPFIKIIDRDSTYRTTWMSRSIPPSRGYKLDKFVFSLLITITVVGKETWDKPFALVYKIPGPEAGHIVINEERYELSPEKFNEFVVEVRTKHEGWAKFELAIYDEQNGDIYIPENAYPLRRRDFLLK